jgi:aspartate/methionine/tyrosine aminotransferase
MPLPTFKLEEYLTQYEFSAPYLLCCSDAETMSVNALLTMASTEDANRWQNQTLRYTEPFGDPALRTQIAETLYPGMSADHILCFAGAEEGIFASLTLLCQPDKHVIVLAPCYQSLKEIPAKQGSQVSTILLQEANNWKIDLNTIAQALKPNTSGIIINFPHNPTGQIITQAELTDLVALCEQHDLWLFSDEVYRLLGNPSSGWASPAATLYPKALSLGVMSKAYGMPGLRVGWIACQDKALLERIKKLKDYLSICNSGPSELLSLIALKNQAAILARNNAIVENNLALVEAFISHYEGLFQWVRPQGGCVGFVRYKGKDTVDNFCQTLVKQAGVLLLPGSVYDCTTPHFRLGFGRKTMPDSLNRLEGFLSRAIR